MKTKKKILVADDEPNVVKLLSARLKANNYDVIAAFDGMQAINMAHKNKPDLIIMDIKMPAGSGINAYEKLQKSASTSLIPVIFITAYASDKVRKEVADLGAAGYVTKPFDASMLLNMIERIFASEDYDREMAEKE